MNLEVSKITFRYQKKEPAVLEAFSAVFEKGETVAVLGPNGTGKTTLGKLIMGILQPQEGSFFLEGEDMKSWSLAERGRKIGYVMQNPARQIFSTTVREEIAYGLEAAGMEQETVREKSREYLELMELSGYEEAFPFHLSCGEKQRLVLASVLAMEPDYLLLDEPTSSLDQKRRRQLGDCLERVRNARGCGIILISHDMEFVRKHACRRIFLGGRNPGAGESGGDEYV